MQTTTAGKTSPRSPHPRSPPPPPHPPSPAPSPTAPRAARSRSRPRRRSTRRARGATAARRRAAGSSAGASAPTPRPRRRRRRRRALQQRAGAPRVGPRAPTSAGATRTTTTPPPPPPTRTSARASGPSSPRRASSSRARPCSRACRARLRAVREPVQVGSSAAGAGGRRRGRRSASCCGRGPSVGEAALERERARERVEHGGRAHGRCIAHDVVVATLVEHDARERERERLLVDVVRLPTFSLSPTRSHPHSRSPESLMGVDTRRGCTSLCTAPAPRAPSSLVALEPPRPDSLLGPTRSSLLAPRSLVLLMTARSLAAP